MQNNPGANNSKGLRVLVVEDYLDSATAIARLLRAVGHQPQIAGDVKTALQLAETETFDLLISDISLPDGDGLELMRHMRQAGPMKGIALSGLVSPEHERESREAGFSAHIGKPFDFAVLIATIERVCNAGKS